MLTIIIRKSKANYYTTIFNQNKSDIKQTWKEIKKIVNINKKSNAFPATIKDGKKHCNE